MNRTLVAALAAALVVLSAVSAGCAAAANPDSALDRASETADRSYRAFIATTFDMYLSSYKLNGSSHDELLDATDELIDLARESPDGISESSEGKTRTMRQVLGDAAADSAGYENAVSKRLELAIETLPPPK
jgi:Spy/CpxP family protein refolding chaperone